MRYRTETQLQQELAEVWQMYRATKRGAQAAIEAAVAAERERCAKHVEDTQRRFPEDGLNGWLLAAELRAAPNEAKAMNPNTCPQMTDEEDMELSAALGWPGGISEPLLDRAALLRLVASATVELASMRRCFEAADRERSELRERAKRAEAERDALRVVRPSAFEMEDMPARRSARLPDDGR